MRIMYENDLDSLTASSLTALTEATLFPATNVLDQRLTTQWKTTSAADQTLLFDAGGAEQPMFQATTNLVTNPEDLTATGWSTTNVAVTTSGTILGYQSNKVTATATGATVYVGSTVPFTVTAGTVMAIARKGSIDTTFLQVVDASASTTIGRVNITFSTKTVTYVTGTKALPAEWIDDITVRVNLKPTTITPASNNQVRCYAHLNGVTGDYTYWTEVLAVDNPYPLGYTATSRAAWATSGTIAYRLPPSGKFIVDCEFKPYFSYDSGVLTQYFAWHWYVDAFRLLGLYYSTSTKKMTMTWHDGAVTESLIASTAFDAGTALTVNQNIRACVSLDIASAGTVTGSRMIIIPRSQGALMEATAWSTAIDALSSSTFTTLQLGRLTFATNPSDMMFKYLRIYGGTLTESITTEADLDDALAIRNNTYDQTYQGKFSANMFAILGHTISPEASIRVEMNDWDEWNYVTGSSASIIRQALTWNDETILYFFDAVKKRQYIKVTVNDPNADDIAIGRIWAGKYLTISPSSLNEFRVTKRRSDRNTYGKNRQKFSDIGTGWRRFELTFPRTATAMLDKVQWMFDTVGNHSSVIFANFDEVRDYLIVEPCYCSLDGDIGFGHKGRMQWDYKLSLEEDK